MLETAIFGDRSITLIGMSSYRIVQRLRVPAVPCMLTVCPCLSPALSVLITYVVVLKFVGSACRKNPGIDREHVRPVFILFQLTIVEVSPLSLRTLRRVERLSQTLIAGVCGPGDY